MLAVAVAAIAAPIMPSAAAPVAAATDRPLVLAYYYIWYTPGSWDRAKTDLPALGTYDSADPSVIRQHVAWAKSAGIDALIVSWKHEARLDKPLEALMSAAREVGLGLVLLYQGLDFSRQPLEAGRVADDLTWFVDHYASDPVFGIFGTPVIILSGTPSFSTAELVTIRAALKGAGDVRLLGSERDASAYHARRDVLDGDAYYWSSVDPVNDSGYERRMNALANELRADAALWIAPVAPGFDARLIGGHRIIERADGETYRAEWAAALATNPDALGIISWNEFSENSHIEPSVTYQATYLELTSALVRETLGRETALDPSPAPPSDAVSGPVIVSGPGPTPFDERLVGALLALLILGPLAWLARSRATNRPVRASGSR
jgi:hypothetical protein